MAKAEAGALKSFFTAFSNAGKKEGGKSLAEIAGEYGGRSGAWWSGIGGQNRATIMGAGIGGAMGWLGDSEGTSLDGLIGGAILGAGAGRYGWSGKQGFDKGGWSGAWGRIKQDVRADVFTAKTRLGRPTNVGWSGPLRPGELNPNAGMLQRLKYNLAKRFPKISSTLQSSFGNKLFRTDLAKARLSFLAGAVRKIPQASASAFQAATGRSSMRQNSNQLYRTAAKRQMAWNAYGNQNKRAWKQASQSWWGPGARLY